MVRPFCFATIPAEFFNIFHKEFIMSDVVKFQSNLDGIVFVEGSKIFTDSLAVAKVFGKEHYNVLRDIKNLACSEEFGALNFEATSYFDEWNRKKPKHNMTRDGFTILAMGYNGKKAVRFKEAYIAAFNQMESQIKINQANSVEIMADNYEFTRRQLRQANAEIKSLQGKLLSVTPYWAKIKHCKGMELTHAETGRVIGKSTQFVSGVLKKMATLGIKPESVFFRQMLLEGELECKRRDTAAFKRLFPEQYEQVEKARPAVLEGCAV